MGLAVLPYMEHILKERKVIVDFYDSHLNFDKLQKLKIREHTSWNYSYYPVIFENEEKLLLVQKKLNEADIFPRRYFYPSLNTVNYVNGKEMPISESISNKILCLPLYVGLEMMIINKICQLIND
jgi:dTDP-4-amino-4,6-dideoxygalactose transaminase